MVAVSTTPDFPLPLSQSVHYFCSSAIASLHTSSVCLFVFPFGSAVAALSFLQHELHCQVQQCVQGRAVQDQWQHGPTAVHRGVLQHLTLPAAQCELLW